MASAVALSIIAALAVGACAVRGDAQPRALSISTTTTEVSDVPTSGGAAALVYYVRNSKLLPVRRSLPDRRVETVLSALLETPEPVERIKGLGSSIPTGTELLGLQTSGGTVSVDLSKSFENVVGPSRQQAIAQLVLTTTELPDIRAVKFLVNGKPVQVTSPTRGDTTNVTDCDYESLLPTREEVQDASLDAATTARLDLRRETLAQRCPPATTGSP